MIIFHASRHFSTACATFRRAWVVALLAFAACLSLEADPAPSLDELDVLDQGRQLTFLWHFYPKQLPREFTLRKKNAESIKLDNFATLRRNLTDLASAAFSLTLDGKPAPLTAIRDLMIAPDGGCLATLVYPGGHDAHLALRANLMPYYPTSYLMNYRIYSPLRPSQGISGYFVGGAPSATITYRQIKGAGQAAPPVFDPGQIATFKSQLKTPWVNENWLILCLVLLLMLPPARVAVLATVFLVEWAGLCAFGPFRPLPISPLLPGILTAALGFLATLRQPWARPVLLAGAAAAGVLNALADQAVLSLPETGAPFRLAALLGFAVSVAAILGIGALLLSECRKYPYFQAGWAPKLGWALGALALVLSLKSEFFA